MSRPGTIDWDKVNATTAADIDRQAKEDGTDDTNHLSAPYPTPATRRKTHHIPACGFSMTEES